MTSTSQIHVFYAGRVQGVGFRVTAEEVAQRLGVGGWVKNLRDGRVELIAEGAEDTLKAFLETVRSGPMKNFIEREDVTWTTSGHGLKDFTTRY
jgi:acylphosphatase